MVKIFIEKEFTSRPLSLMDNPTWLTCTKPVGLPIEFLSIEIEALFVEGFLKSSLKNRFIDSRLDLLPFVLSLAELVDEYEVLFVIKLGTWTRLLLLSS
jgi:hypothetical protein